MLFTSHERVCTSFLPYMVYVHHYSDVNMSAMVSQLLAQPFVQANIKENIKVPRHWPLWGESTTDQWIPLTQGQLRWKCFHLMTPCPHTPGISVWQQYWASTNNNILHSVGIVHIGCSNISHTLVGNKIVDYSDVVGASPDDAAPTTSSFST